MLQDHTSRLLAPLLALAMFIVGPASSVANSCCDPSQSGDGTHWCLSCAKSSAADSCKIAADAGTSCCSNSENPQPIRAGATTCACCPPEGSEPVVPQRGAAEVVTAASEGFLLAGNLVADISLTSAGRVAIQLPCAASLLDRSRQVLFSVWRP